MDKYIDKYIYIYAYIYIYKYTVIIMNPIPFPNKIRCRLILNTHFRFETMRCCCSFSFWDALFSGGEMHLKCRYSRETNGKPTT